MPKQTISKAAWIRENDAKQPSAELIAKAKKQGIVITAAQVYTTRAETKKKAAKGTIPPPKASPAASGGSIDALVRAIVRDEIRRYFTER